MRNKLFKITLIFLPLLFSFYITKAQTNFSEKADEYLKKGIQLAQEGEIDAAILKGDSAINFVTEAILQEGRTPALLAKLAEINWKLKGVFLTEVNQGKVYRNMVFGVKKGADFLSEATLVGFIDCMVSYQKNAKALDDNNLWECYWLVNNRLSNLDIANADSLIQNIDKKLFTVLDNSCEGITNRYKQESEGGVYYSDTQIKEIEKYYENSDCEDYTFLYNTKKVLYEKNPNAESALGILKMALLSKNNQYLKEAKKLSEKYMNEDSEISQKLRLEVARYNILTGNKKEGRDLAETLKGTNYQKEAFTLIGDLYFNSFMDIVSNKYSECQNLSVYSLAYEMYQIANNMTGMKKCKAKFPTKNMIFMENRTENEKVRFSGWVNRTTILRIK
ncbi:hypothetical protein [Flammeovirga aprica]|uniref:Tetratricopeptide repeat protein n=1 Tax=Flammeovirga aprica JL-4 TaxID=694437 RepID=A0A7X9P341_9BACT|nr:hypothetical protein [Flammeovirga aprica]NME67527.1 hypothetical protein [Flammeovirga aprica JL-4]